MLVRLLVPSPHFVDVEGKERRGRNLALLTYLLLGDPAGISRDELMEMLWDPKPGPGPSPNMRTLLHEVRSLIPEGIVLTDGRRVRVDPSLVDCDLLRLRDALIRNDVTTVLELYGTGAFETGMPGGARGFEEWADGLRRRLRLEVVEVLEDVLESRSDLSSSLQMAVARRLALLEPEDPEGWFRLLTLAVEHGDRGAGHFAGDRLQALAEEEGDERSPAVSRLLRQLREEDHDPPGVLLRLPFVGRDRQLERLRDLVFRLSRQQEGAVVGIGGASGIGKSRFLGEVVGPRSDGDLLWVRVSAFEIESRTPLAVLPSLLRPLLVPEVMDALQPGERRVLADLLPGSAEEPLPSGSVPPLAAREAALAVVRTAAARRPLAVLIDDAHNCDQQTLEFLHRLGAEGPSLPVLLVLTFRDTAQRALTPFLAAVSAVLLRLPPLSREDIREALRELGTLPEADAGERIVTLLEGTSGGIPLVLQEQLRRLDRDGLIRLVDGAWVARGMELHAGEGQGLAVESLLRSRIEALPAEDQNLVAAAAVANRPSSLTELAVLLGMPPGALTDSVDRLVEAGLLTPAGGEFSLSHASTGDAALDALPEHRRQALFAEALRREVGGSDAPRMPLLGRLRLACGAGANLEAREFLLSLLAGMPWGEARRDEVAGLLQQVRTWAASPAMYARLHGEVERHGGDPEILNARLRALARRRRGSRWLAEWGWKAAALVGVSGALGMALALVMDPGRGAAVDLFAGGGTLVLERDGEVHGLRFTGSAYSDTTGTAVGREGVESGEWIPSPGGGKVLYVCGRESGPPDVCLRDGDTDRGVLAPGPGDDFPRDWSPDERRALILSDRNSRPPESFGYDIHVVDVEGGSTWNLSRDPFVNYEARWSPDGTRVAYTMTVPGGDSLVIRTASGDPVAGTSLGGILRPFAWNPGGTLLAVVHEHRELVVLDDQLQVLERHPLDDGPQGFALAWSPDGSALALSPVLGLQSTVRVVALNRGGLVVGRYSGRLLGWHADRPPPHLEEVRPLVPPVVRVGEPFQVGLLGWNSRGAPMAPRMVAVQNPDPQRWQLLPPDTLVALAAGEAALEVTAGGWRSAAATVEVEEAVEPRLVFTEDWSAGIDSLRWHPWGDPQPRIRMDLEGRPAMWNAGDHHYPSGLVTREAFPTAQGLTVEWLQRTPLTGEYWQEVWMTLHPDGIERFRKEGEPYRTEGGGLVHLGIPIQVGSPPEAHAFMHCGEDADGNFPFQDSFTNTGWHRVSLQIFSGGGCELRVDGTLVLRTLPSGGAPWPPLLRLGLGGRTHATDVLIGEVRAWVGVR